jgi:AcrR family transcriptional regulator
MSKSSAARLNLVDTAANMLRRRGLNATSIRELAKESKAPLGSTYHYFPGGKSQVIQEALEYAGSQVELQLEQALEAGPQEGIRFFVNQWASAVKAADYRAGCTVMAVAVEEPRDSDGEKARATAAEVFSHWEALLAASLRKSGIERRSADELATTVVACIEGAVAMARAKRSLKPMERVGNQLDNLLAAARRINGQP